MSRKLSNYDFEKVIKFIDEGMSKIAGSNGKDIIVLIGRTGAGKSTTINALSGEILKEGKKGIIPSGPAKMGDGKKSETSQPQLISGKGKFSFLDTMGFNDVRGNVAMEISSSILLEMALKPARTS